MQTYTPAPDCEIIPIAPRDLELEIASTLPALDYPGAALSSPHSIAFPRASGELKGALTWEKLDRVSGALPNLLTMMFTIGD